MILESVFLMKGLLNLNKLDEGVMSDGTGLRPIDPHFYKDLEREVYQGILKYVEDLQRSGIIGPEIKTKTVLEWLRGRSG